MTGENVVKLNEIPGVGKKTAERLVLEMKDKVVEWFPQLEEAQAGSVSGSLQGDVVSALVNWAILRILPRGQSPWRGRKWRRIPLRPF